MIRSRSANFLMYCVCVLAMMSACKTSSNATSDEASDLVGAPPSTGQDPFASQVKPPESARVPTSGVMDVSTKTPSESEAVVVEEKDPSPPDPVKPEDIEQSPRARVEPATPAPETLESRVKQTEVAKQPDVYQCFSCVKICPESDPTSDCSRSQEDMICGWGFCFEHNGLYHQEDWVLEAFLHILKELGTDGTIHCAVIAGEGHLHACADHEFTVIVDDRYFLHCATGEDARFGWVDHSLEVVDAIHSEVGD